MSASFPNHPLYCVITCYNTTMHTLAVTAFVTNYFMFGLVSYQTAYFNFVRDQVLLTCCLAWP